jgi:bacterial/archaeal transporter family-2 protein
MQNINWYSGLAIFGGCLLALMIHLNGELALHTSALSASWTAHCIGAIAAWCLFAASGNKNKSANIDAPCAPKIFYLGGLPGAFTVILASITVNSNIGLSGTLALALVGQLLCSMICERFALFQLPKKTFSFVDLAPILLIILGSVILIYAK